MNILVILPPALSDVVCSTALLRCVHRQVSGAQLHVVVPEEFAHVLVANPHIARLVPTPELHINLSPVKYAVVVDVANLYENEQWAAAAGIRYLSPKSSFFSNFFGMFGQKVVQHSALEMVGIAKPLGVRYDGEGLNYFIAPEFKVPQQDIPVAHSAGFVVLALGNGAALHGEVLQHFCKNLQFPIMITGPREMYASAQALAKTDNVKVYAACGKFSDGETADLINRSRMVVSADAGWMQVAAAWGKPVVAWIPGKGTGAQIPPLYAAHHIQEKGVPFASVQPSKAALATSSTAEAHSERTALGEAMVQLVNGFLFKK
jgi:ADP-heptose:LPS heptosyltransferase